MVTCPDMRQKVIGNSSILLEDIVFTGIQKQIHNIRFDKHKAPDQRFMPENHPNGAGAAIRMPDEMHRAEPAFGNQRRDQFGLVVMGQLTGTSPAIRCAGIDEVWCHDPMGFGESGSKLPPLPARAGAP